ncbi:helix-turn-helix domain-containing protein [Streptomyces sp. NPDC051016]|uniref:helix-turn-helix domain-containing protein n=1 Tax=Streptomyces sp. NPDC051016 TaxID=3365638 RepID=UPI0037B6659D
MTDAPQGRAQKFFAAVDPPIAEAGLDGYGPEAFFAVVLPLLERAGYTGYGSQQRLGAQTGMSPGTVSRLIRRQTVPDIQAFPALGKIIGMTPLELLVLAGHFPPSALESQQTLSETNQSQVGFEGITPEEAAARAADELGFHDEVRRSIFFGMIETLRKTNRGDDQADDSTGGAAAQM